MVRKVNAERLLLVCQQVDERISSVSAYFGLIVKPSSRKKPS
jgi:hypothetical protein